MKHYSIWLEKYSTIKKDILDELQSCRTLIEESLREIPSEELIKPLDKGKPSNGRMCFVDGGEGMVELLGASLYFIRASGLLLDDIKNGKKEQEFIRDLDMNLMDYDDYTKERVELLRECMEFDVALKCVEQHKPEYLFLDGSLYVKARRRPIKCTEDTVYRKKFVRLLKTCRKNNVNLVGVSEDSHSKLFSNHLAAKYRITLPKFMTDSSMLKLLAGNREFRTVQFTPKSKFDAGGKDVTTFPTAYIQVSGFSNPLRVDTADWNKPIGETLTLITELSKGSRYYGYPIPMYLAHMDAKINPKHAEWAANQLSKHIMKNDPALYDAVLRKNTRSLRPK